MTASDKRTNQIKKDLLCRSHPHKTFAATDDPKTAGIEMLKNLPTLGPYK
jgi:hypothetical protein